MTERLRPIAKKALGGAAIAVMAAAVPAGQALETDFRPITDPIKQDVRARQRREEDQELMTRKRRTDLGEEPTSGDVLSSEPSLGSPTDIPEVFEQEVLWVESPSTSDEAAAESAAESESPARATKTRSVLDRHPELRGPVRSGVASKFPELANVDDDHASSERSL